MDFFSTHVKDNGLMVEGEIVTRSVVLRQRSTMYTDIKWQRFPFKDDINIQLEYEIQRNLDVLVPKFPMQRHSGYQPGIIGGGYWFFYTKFITVNIEVGTRTSNIYVTIEKKTIMKQQPEEPTFAEWEAVVETTQYRYQVCHGFVFTPIVRGVDTRGRFIDLDRAYTVFGQENIPEWVLYEELIYPTIRRSLDAMYFCILQVRNVYKIMMLNPNAHQNDNPLAQSVFQQCKKRLDTITRGFTTSIVQLSRQYSNLGRLEGVLPEPTVRDVFNTLMYALRVPTVVPFTDLIT